MPPCPVILILPNSHIDVNVIKVKMIMVIMLFQLVLNVNTKQQLPRGHTILVKGFSLLLRSICSVSQTTSLPADLSTIVLTSISQSKSLLIPLIPTQPQFTSLDTSRTFWAIIPSDFHDSSGVLLNVMTRETGQVASDFEDFRYHWQNIRDSDDAPVWTLDSPATRVIEPCYWTAFTHNWLVCSQDTDASGNFIAVESCVDQSTHQISCKCNPSYNGPECRSHITITSSDDRVIDPNQIQGGATSDPAINIRYEHLVEEMDYNAKAFPSMIFLQFPNNIAAQNSIAYNQPMVLSAPIDSSRGKMSLTSFNQKTESNIVGTVGQTTSYNRYINHPIHFNHQPLTSHNQLYLTTSLFALGSSPINKIIDTVQIQKGGIGPQSPHGQFSKDPISSLSENFGLSCPSNILTQSGCLCGHSGIFGPHCGFKFTLLPSANGTRPMMNGYSWIDQEYSYHLSTITPSSTSTTSYTFTLPTNYHFELSFIDSALSSSPDLAYMPSRIALKTDINRKTFRIPGLDQFTLSNTDPVYHLYLVSDSHPIEYLIQPMSLIHDRSTALPQRCDAKGTKGVSATTQVFDTRAVLTCECLPNYYGIYCQYRGELDALIGNNIQVMATGIGRNDNMIVEFEISFAELENSIPLNNPTQYTPIGYFLSAVPTSLSQVPTYSHQLTLVAGNKLRYSGELMDYTGPNTQYELSFVHDEVVHMEIGTLSTHFSAPLSDMMPQQTVFGHFNNAFTQPFSLTMSCLINPLGCPLTIAMTVGQGITFNNNFNTFTDSTAHLNANPFVITHTEAVVVITIPAYSQVTTSARLRLRQYPVGSTANTYLSTPITINSMTFNPTVRQTIQLVVPKQLISNKLFYSITMSPTTIYTLVTPVFATIPQCYRPPASKGLYPDRIQWVPKCQNGGECLASTQECKCTTDWTGSLCQQAVPVDQRPCHQCNPTHIDTCNTQTNQCVCNKDYFESTCDTPVTCQSQSAKKCNGDNGSFKFASPDTCSSAGQCICNNSWSGLSRQSCTLQCGDGEPYRDCDRCGCPAGKSGSNCQCNSVVGGVTFNGYNEALIMYFNALESIKVSPTAFSQEQIDDMMFANNAVVEAVNSTFARVLGLQQNSLIFKIEPIKNPFLTTTPSTGPLLDYTHINIIISYGCDQYNNNITKDNLSKLWSILTRDLATDKQIQEIFTFPANEPAQLNPDGDLENTDPTLPEGHDRLPVTEEPKKDSNNSTIIIAVVVSVVGCLLIILIVVIVYKVTQKKQDNNNDGNSDNKTQTSTISQGNNSSTELTHLDLA